MFASCPVRIPRGILGLLIVMIRLPISKLSSRSSGSLATSTETYGTTLRGCFLAKKFREISSVIIDAPPRITTGFVNALCASTYLVVPFVLDRLSAERVGQTLERISRMKGQLFPHIGLAGVVGTMKGDKTSVLRDAEKESIEE